MVTFILIVRQIVLDHFIPEKNESRAPFVNLSRQEAQSIQIFQGPRQIVKFENVIRVSSTRFRNLCESRLIYVTCTPVQLEIK